MIGSVVYFAHPVGGDVTANVARAVRWLHFLMRVEPSVSFAAPWLACLLSGIDDNDELSRARGLRDSERFAARCDGIVLCGGRISTGMMLELAATRTGRGWVSSLVPLGAEPPSLEMTPRIGGSIIEWGRVRWREAAGE